MGSDTAKGCSGKGSGESTLAAVMRTFWATFQLALVNTSSAVATESGAGLVGMKRAAAALLLRAQAGRSTAGRTTTVAEPGFTLRRTVATVAVKPSLTDVDWAVTCRAAAAGSVMDTSTGPASTRPLYAASVDTASTVAAKTASVWPAMRVPALMRTTPPVANWAGCTVTLTTAERAALAEADTALLSAAMPEVRRTRSVTGAEGRESRPTLKDREPVLVDRAASLVMPAARPVRWLVAGVGVTAKSLRPEASLSSTKAVMVRTHGVAAE
mmetsp:Transcript_16618/g.62938  ORF Transcript_16618/g.62938 Transcript_16618/m.62938 type:complete len:270 (-) Transcript_16618:2467-3276(-)